jgi:hypothetical protein
MRTPPAPSAPLRDPRNQRLGTASHEAAGAAETALWRLMSFVDTPLADLDRAHAADPGWSLPLTMRAGYLMSLGEPARWPEVQALIEQAAPLAQAGPPRELQHLHAVQALLDGRCHQACELWDELLLRHPRDALALQWAQQWDLQRGDAAHLRARPARVLPEWDSADPLYPHLLGLYAFGLQEDHSLSMAEDVGRRALALDERVPWAVHAVAHVMEAQGRHEDGTAWLRQHQAGWAEGHDFSSHLWWHMGLFRLEALDLPGVHRLVDAHLCGDALRLVHQRQDAVSLLWRMHLLGEDVGARYTLLLRDWPLDEAEAGLSAFNDLHVLLALLGAGDLLRAEHWLAACAARALRAEDAARSNHAVSREVGLPVMRGLLALAQGDDELATTTLYRVLPRLWQLGGSAAQREVITLSLVVASARTGQPSVARALLNERRLSRADSPFTRRLAENVRSA